MEARGQGFHDNTGYLDDNTVSSTRTGPSFQAATEMARVQGQNILSLGGGWGGGGEGWGSRVGRGRIGWATVGHCHYKNTGCQQLLPS